MPRLVLSLIGFLTPCISTQLREEAAKANGSTVKGRLFQSNAFKLLMMNAEEAAAAATANRPRMRQSAVPRTLWVSVDSVCTTFPMVNTQPGPLHSGPGAPATAPPPPAQLHPKIRKLVEVADEYLAAAAARGEHNAGPGLGGSGGRRVF